MVKLHNTHRDVQMGVILKNWVYFYIMRSNWYIGKNTINFARVAQLRKLQDHVKYMPVYIELNRELTVAEVHPKLQITLQLQRLSASPIIITVLPNHLGNLLIKT